MNTIMQAVTNIETEVWTTLHHILKDRYYFFSGHHHGNKFSFPHYSLKEV